MNTLGNLRRPVVWEARHHNGWTTIIAQQKDGSFVAFASNGEAVCVDYVGFNVAHAHAAVIAALRWKSGHRRCTEECSDWQMVNSAFERAPDSEHQPTGRDPSTQAA
jgi:hypothetical protein